MHASSPAYVTPVLRQLHWLPVRRCPSWFTSRWTAGRRCKWWAGHRRLQSSNVVTRNVNRTRTSLGDRSFAIAGPRLRNNLPLHLPNSGLTLLKFRRLLKVHSFAWRSQRLVTVFSTDFSVLYKCTCLLTYSLSYQTSGELQYVTQLPDCWWNYCRRQELAVDWVTSVTMATSWEHCHAAPTPEAPTTFDQNNSSKQLRLARLAARQYKPLNHGWANYARVYYAARRHVHVRKIFEVQEHYAKLWTVTFVSLILIELCGQIVCKFSRQNTWLLSLIHIFVRWKLSFKRTKYICGPPTATKFSMWPSVEKVFPPLH